MAARVSDGASLKKSDPVKGRALRRLGLFSLCALWFVSAPALAAVDLVLNVADDPDPVAAGGVVTYTVRVNATAVSDLASAITTVHAVPSTTIYRGFTGAPAVSCTGMDPGDPGPGTLTCTHPDLDKDELSEFDVLIEFQEQGTFTFGAVVQVGGVAVGAPGSELTTVSRGANFSISKTPPTGATQAGGLFSWDLTVENAGPYEATNLRVQDPIPTGFHLTSTPLGCSVVSNTIICDVAGPIAAGGTHNVATVTGVISAGSSSTVTNTASVALSPAATVADATDPDTADNTAISNITINPGSDLSITKKRDKAGNFLVGETLNFILETRYSGDAPGSQITVTDVVPSNYTIGSVLSPQGSWTCSVSGQIVTCVQPAPGTGAGYMQSLGDISIPVTVATAGANIANTAQISSSDPDPTPGNNTATDGGVTLLDPTVDLTVSKSGPTPPLVVAGVPFNFTLGASNAGTADFYGTIEVTDTLPSGMSITGYPNLNGWSCSPAASVATPVTGSFTCTRTYTAASPLAAGATIPAVTVTAEVNANGAFTNSARIEATSCNLGPGNCGGNTATYNVTGSVSSDSADVSVLKTVVGPDPVPAGDELTYRIEVVNAGPSVSNDVVMTDTLGALINNSKGPTGSGFISATVTPGLASSGTCTDTTSGASGRALSCTFSSVPVCVAGSGDCPVIEVKVRPGGNGGARSNTARVISNGTADPDHSNETATVSSQIDPRADISVTKNANPASVAAGQNLTYVVTVPNAGPSRAQDVVATDILPEDVTFVSAVPSAGSCPTTPGAETTTTATNKTLTCNLGTINSGAQATITIIVRPNVGHTGHNIVNNVDVTTTTVETNTTNNHADVTAGVAEPSLDLVLNKSDSVDPVAVGDDTVYTVRVNNLGPSAAETVVITDTLPAIGLSFKLVTVDGGLGTCTAIPSVGSYGGTLSCEFDYLPAGGERSIKVTMTGEARGTVTNTAEVTSRETVAGYESNTANNEVNETTTVRTKADMEVVSKTPSVTPVSLRDPFDFIVVVRNNTGVGLAEADEVVVSDTLPAGMVLTGTPTVALVSGTVGSSSCTGTTGGTTFTCDLGTVSSGGEVKITVPVRVVTVTSQDQVFTNRATVKTSSLDINGGSNPNAGNNFNEGQVTIQSSSLAGKVYRDFDNNAAFDGDDTGIAGVNVTLTGTAKDGTSIAPITVTTDSNGNYVFPLLPEGTYTISEGPISDINLADGSETVGTYGGNISVNDVISGINLPGASEGTGYLFAEIPLPRIGIAKSASAVTNNGDGTYDVTFSLAVANYGATGLENVQVTDDVGVGGTEPGLGTYTTSAIPLAGQYTIVGAPVVSSQTNGASLTPVAAGVFTGSGSGTNLLVAGSSTLPGFGSGSRSSALIQFTARFFPTTPGPFENNATTDAQSPAGQPTHDDSVDGPNPDPDGNGNPNDNQSPTIINLSGQSIGVAKARTSVVQTGDGRYQVAYSIIVVNPGTVTATNVQVTDDLVATFPTAQSRTIAIAPAISACTGTVLNANSTFNGAGQKQLLIGNQPLQPSEQCTITFTVEVGFGSSAMLPATVQNNQAVATTSESPGGTVIATDQSNDGATFVAGDNSPTPVDFSDSALASISGKVWRDIDHDRVDNEGPEERVAGFIVEVLNASGQVVGTAITAADGTYTVRGLYPSDGTPATVYSIRFREPTSGNIYGVPLSQDPDAARNGTVSNGVITGLQLAAGVNTSEQNLPLDPSGVVYDSVSRMPVSGATVTLVFGGTEVPAACLVGGQNAQVTGANGMYQYLLINPPPAGCPGNGEYTIKVQQPSGYLPPASTIIPPTGGPYAPVGAPGGVDPIQPQAGPPTGTVGPDTKYYFAFNLTVGGVGVVNNHIPLDPAGSDVFFVTKTGSKSIVELGDTLKYTVTARVSNGIALAAAQLTDNLPAGFRYIPGTATIAKGGAAAVALADPAGSPGPRLVFEIGTFDSSNPVTVTYRVRAGVGSMQGDGVNRVQGRSGSVASNIARFKVKVTGGVFTDLACVAGKVFVDCNGNHIQDAEEIGIPGVRLYMEDGTYFITDSEGKYSYCGITPRTHVLKADSMTLPRGSRLTVTSSRNVGDANSIFLDVKNGELIRADFAEGSCSNTVLEQVKARRGQGEVNAPETEKRGAPALKFEGKAPNYPRQGTDSANQILVKPRSGSGDAPVAESVNNAPVPTLPSASGNTRGNNLRDQQNGGASVH